LTVVELQSSFLLCCSFVNQDDDDRGKIGSTQLYLRLTPEQRRRERGRERE
jgi:hypothetical protein